MRFEAQSNGSPACSHACRGFIGCSHALFIALAAALLCAPDAFARQVEQAHWNATETRGTGISQGELAIGVVPIGEALLTEDGCGIATCHATLARTELTVDLQITTQLVACEWVFQCVAGNEGLTLQCGTGELAIAVKSARKWRVLAVGESLTLEPGENALMYVDVGAAALSNVTAQLLVTAGSLATVEGLSGYWYAPTGQEWICTGAANWLIGEEDISCPNVPYPTCGGDDMYVFGVASKTDIGISLYAGPYPNIIEVQCEFLLATDCCAAFHQVSGPYCDVFPTIDGQELPRPAGTYEPCRPLEGLIALSAGWHTLSGYTYDLGSGDYTLHFTQGDCGLDCNNNAQPDSQEISWAAVYENIDLDTDLDAQLDSCERAYGDLNLDGIVGSADLAIMLNNWGGDSIGDMNADGNVNAIDLGILLAGWSRS